MNDLQEYRKAHHLCVRCGKPAKVKWNGTILTKCEECLKDDVYRSQKHRMKLLGDKFQEEASNQDEIPCRACHVLVYPEYVYCPWCGVKLEET